MSAAKKELGFNPGATIARFRQMCRSGRRAADRGARPARP